MLIFLRQVRRQLLLWIIFAVALSLAVSILLIAVGSWNAIRLQATAVDENYITIAIMTDVEFSTPFIDEVAMETALKSPCVVRYDSRCMLGAEVKGCKALTSGAVERNDYQFAFDHPSYDMVVLAVTCNSVETFPSFPITVYDGEREIEQPTYEEYNVSAVVNEAVSIADGYEPPKAGDEITLFGGRHREDGTIPFEVGKTYLVFGYFYDHQIVYNLYESTDEATGQFAWKVVEEPNREKPYSLRLFDDWEFEILSTCPRDGNGSVYELEHENYSERTLLGQRENGTFYYYPMPNAWVHSAEYSGSVESFLNSEAGDIWKNQTIPLCELNQHSASVVLTDDLQSIYMFNNGYAEVIEGREMTADETVNGVAVCLVSVEYAKYNNLHVGDKISIEYYDTTLVSDSAYEIGMNDADDATYQVTRHGVLIPENRLGVEKNYEVVGIYSAPAFRGGTHLFTADTIFAPKKSLPNAEKYEERGFRALQSLVLRNGTEEEFFETLKHGSYNGEWAEIWFDNPNDIDFSGDFMTFNQQYDKAAGNIEVMRSNARRLLILAIMGFLIVLAAVRYFEARRQRAIVVTMKKLGIARRRIVRELIGAGLLLDLTATALGGLAAWLLFGEITRRANVGTLQLPLPTLLISAAATAIVLTLTTFFSASRLSRIALMETKK